MRKLSLEKQESRKKKRTQIIVIVVLGLLLFGTVAYSFMSRGAEQTNEQKIILNEYDFFYIDGFYLNQDKEIFLKNNPKEVQSMNLESEDINSLESYNQKPIYIYAEDISEANRLKIILSSYALRVNDACPEKFNCEGDIPTKNCDDYFIKVQVTTDGEPKIEKTKNCILIKAKENEIDKAVDYYLLKASGII